MTLSATEAATGWQDSPTRCARLPPTALPATGLPQLLVPWRTLPNRNGQLLNHNGRSGRPIRALKLHCSRLGSCLHAALHGDVVVVRGALVALVALVLVVKAAAPAAILRAWPRT